MPPCSSPSPSPSWWRARSASRSSAASSATSTGAPSRRCSRLGPVADPAAGGALPVRPDQPRGRQPELDERHLRVPWREPDLQPARDRAVLDGGLRHAPRRPAPDLARAAGPRRDAEPAHGRRDGHQDRLGRCADLRPRLRRRRYRGRGAVADRQRQPEPRPGLHHRQLPRRGVRRRWESLGHPRRRAHPRHGEQVPRALRGRGARKDRAPRRHHPVHPEAAARHLRAQGPGGGSMSRLLDRTSVVLLVIVLGAAVLIPALNLAVAPGSPLHLNDYLVPLLGKYLCFALLALSMDLIWGFAGILSLGHGAFFALGGYAAGMYLMRQVGSRGVYGNPILPDFMVFLNWKELPWFWLGFDHFWFAALMVVLVPGLLAFVFGWFAFRSRVTGVYLSIITQALTFALMLGFFRNNFGFGGNNGLTDFKDILGFNIQASGTRAALFSISCWALALGFLICRAIISSKFGKVLIAIRDAESRVRFLGYRVESYKLLVFTLSACMAGVAGALYVPQVGIINPSEFQPGNSIEAVIWVAVGGRGTLVGAVIGAVLVNAAKTTFTSGNAFPYWVIGILALVALTGVAIAKRQWLVILSALAGLAAAAAGMLFLATLLPNWPFILALVLIPVA